VLTTLGIGNKAIGFIGGFAGEELEGILLNKGIACDFIKISGETRTNIIVDDISTGKQTIFNAEGPKIKSYELAKIIHKVEKLEKPKVVIISGSLPLGIHPEIYCKIIEIVKDKGAKVILDTDGNALGIAIHGCPDVIKPNIHELSGLAGRQLKELNDIISVAGGVHEEGIGIVLVSMGAKGIIMVGEKERYLASPPEVKVENTIGAGDSAVAGFVYGLVEGKSLNESLICAVAAGTATTLRPGTALCQKEDFFKLIPQIELRSI
jgi:6-phosphofructokinase 2